MVWRIHCFFSFFPFRDSTTQSNGMTGFFESFEPFLLAVESHSPVGGYVRFNGGFIEHRTLVLKHSVNQLSIVRSSGELV